MTMAGNTYVSFFDVLGFTSRFISGDLSNHYDMLVQMVSAIDDPGVALFLMSDSIVIVSEDFNRLRDITQEFYTWGILNDFWLRGAITQGKVTAHHERAITEKNRIILPFLGEGYLRAYILQTTLNISGVVIDQRFFDSEVDNPGFKLGVDYIEYEEYLPKIGYEGKTRLLLPKKHSLRQVVDTLYFEEMLKYHVADLDKYINTFCFYIKYLLEHASMENLTAFIEKLLRKFEFQSQHVLIPSKVVTIFIAVVEGLVNRYRLNDENHKCNPGQMEVLMGKVIECLKMQGYLSTFVDSLLDFDKRRRTSIYKEINSLRSHINQAP